MERVFEAINGVFSFIVPLSFLIVFKIQPIVVVFPAPFSPTNPKIDPYVSLKQEFHRWHRFS